MAVVTVAAAAVGFVAGRNMSDLSPAPSDGQSVVEHEHNIPHDPREAQPKYRLGEQDGRLAVYTIGKDTPDLVFDVYIKYLPPVDQEALIEGIIIYDYKELTERIEDYIS